MQVIIVVREKTKQTWLLRSAGVEVDLTRLERKAEGSLCTKCQMSAVLTAHQNLTRQMLLSLLYAVNNWSLMYLFEAMKMARGPSRFDARHNSDIYGPPLPKC